MLAPVFYFLFVSHEPVLMQVSVGVFIVAALTDWYDGVIARSSGMVTNLGKFLDPLADKILTSLAFVAFAAIDLLPWWMVIVIISRDILITLLRVIAERKNAHIVTSKSAQWKTFIQMAALYYALFLTVAQTMPSVMARFGDTIRMLMDGPVVYIIMLAVTILTVITGIQYIYDNREFLLRFFGAPQRAAG